MVQHLTNKIRQLERLVSIDESNLVIDIGSNDATTLKAYTGKFRKVGIDPTGLKFKEFYTSDITLIPDFFTQELKQFSTKTGKPITMQEQTKIKHSNKQTKLF
jgi:hypothetical protein